MISMCPPGTAWPYRVTTAPVRVTSGQDASKAAAIAADAFPAPITTHLPFGGGGRCYGTINAGSARPTAASKIRRNAFLAF
ncbi:hypothetical protein EV184_110255 [Sinorhizobium americanum]|uniref:Uncharacterized protein n=1 Tax=Sinorhizobium americanum TaxID=194963 RepID=A0A4R2BPX5_9HYPH|nr:hypothetical protein EV184_110255 [Sinorhizobium americanum]